MDFPKVSIITPSYNQGKFLEGTIQSVLNQNYPNLEYIIIDGGSTDNSVDIIKKFEDKIYYWISEKDNGQSHAFNKGLEVATGEIIGWINSDDLYYEGAIFDAVNYFRTHNDIDVVFGDYDYIDKYGDVVHTRKEINFDLNIYFWTRDCYHANLSGFFRKSCFDKFGGLREDLQYGMDYELYMRFAVFGCKFGHYKKKWGGYRLHESSKSTLSSDKQVKDGKKIFNEYRKYFDPNVTKNEKVYYLYYSAKRKIKKFIKGAYTLRNISFAYKLSSKRAKRI